MDLQFNYVVYMLTCEVLPEIFGRRFSPAGITNESCAGTSMGTLIENPTPSLVRAPMGENFAIWTRPQQ